MNEQYINSTLCVAARVATRVTLNTNLSLTQGTDWRYTGPCQVRRGG